MANVVCPRCHERVDAPEEAGQARCPFCEQIFALLETRVTADPPGPSQAFQVDPELTLGATANAAVDLPERYASWEEFRALSPAIQREMLKLATQPLPDLRLIYVEPLPETVPAEIDGWSKPLGTLRIDADNVNSKWGTVYALIILALGLFILGFGLSGITWLAGQLKDKADPGLWLYPVFFTGMAGMLVFFAIYIARQIKLPLGLTLWIFEQGVFLSRGGQTSVARFEEVESFEVSQPRGRPLYWLKLVDEDPIVLSVGHTPEVMPLMEYVEIRMAAAQLLPRLKSIFKGNREQFGKVQLDREHIYWYRQKAPWAEVRRVVDDPKNLYVDCAGKRQWCEIRYRDVSFPHLVMAISHVLIEEHSRLTSRDR